MTNNYLIQGNTVTIAAGGALKVTGSLPNGIYTVSKPSPMSPYVLEQGKLKEIPEKVYGSIDAYKDRIIHTFRDRKDSTGVLLAGPKGTGKTLLTRCIAHSLLQQGVPVITVPFSLVCQETVDFISRIDTECTVIFDEIDKVKTDEEDNSTNCLLGLLDGIANFKRLYLFTANNVWGINEYMLNRPGRIYYKIIFKGLQQEAVQEYCKEHLRQQQYTKDVIEIAGRVSDFSFDMLSALVEEVNRYDAAPKEVCKVLNIDFRISGNYAVHVFDKEGKPLSVDRESQYQFLSCTDIDDEVGVYYTDSDGNPDQVRFYISEIADTENGTITFKEKTSGITVKLVPIQLGMAL